MNYLNNNNNNNVATNQTQHETGTQLFARLVNSEKKANTLTSADTSNGVSSSPKPFTQVDKRLIQLENELMLNKTLNLDTHLFTKDMANKDVVEIYGKCNTGKSELIQHLMARFLLPPKWKLAHFTIDLSEYSCLGGKNAELLIEPSQMPKCVLISTDAKFCILRLFTIIENRLKRALTQQQTSNLPPDAHKLTQKFIRDCLKNLVFYQCITNEQLIYSLVACEHYIQTLLSSPQNQQNQNGCQIKSILPVFIDSINSNFEIIDRFNSQMGQSDTEHTEKYCVQLVKRLVDNYNVCVIASRTDLTYNGTLSSGMRNLNFSDFSSSSYKKWQTLVTKRVELMSRNEQENAGSEETAQLVVKTYVRFTELVKKSGCDKVDANVLKNFARFSIKNTGFSLI